MSSAIVQFCLTQGFLGLISPTCPAITAEALTDVFFLVQVHMALDQQQWRLQAVSQGATCQTHVGDKGTVMHHREDQAHRP
ncbi:hypothetical protein AAFF_G00382130 [Aldrovandia affinis]|uniref:Uncharacterized protein n=1 Tax=Aldrovandia affinis TaxID=143900 RepID=A0AAD7T891_9TELE|nr:hypothetical protein AAFF_G00382130 [Aldrovandia affinis]